MRYVIISLVVLLLMPSLASSQLFFSTNDFIIHAKKNVTPFLENENCLKQIVTNLENVSSHIPNSNISIKLSYFLPELANTLQNRISQCISSIENKRISAKKTFLDAINSVERIERALDFIGDAIAYVSGVMGPTQMREEKAIIDGINDNLQNEQVEIEVIQNEIETERDVVLKILPEISSIKDHLDDEQIKLKVAFEIIIAFEKVEFLCNEGNEMADRLSNDANMLKSIHDNGLLNRADPNMFPPKEVLEKISDEVSSSKVESPYFNNEKKISQLYAMQSAVTIIHDDVIHSRMVIPLVDFTNSYNLVNYPDFNEFDTQIVFSLQKIAMKPIDVFGCNDNQRNIRLYSSKDLVSCQKMPKGSTYICSGRNILMKSGPVPCSNFKLPPEVAIELRPDLILLYSLTKSVKIICKNHTSNHPIHAKFSKIKLPTNCEIHGEHFSVNKYKENDETEVSNPSLEIEIVNLPSFDDISFQPIKSTVEANANETQKTIEKVANLEKDINLLKVEKTKVHTKQQEIDSKINHPGFMSTYTMLAFGLLSSVLTLVIGLLCYCKCKKHWKRKFGTKV